MREAPRHVLENSIRDLSCLRIVCTAYDLIAAHGKTSERIDETKRSGGTRMGTDEGSEREDGGEKRTDGWTERLEGKEPEGLRPDKTEAG